MICSICSHAAVLQRTIQKIPLTPSDTKGTSHSRTARQLCQLLIFLLYIPQMHVNRIL